MSSRVVEWRPPRIAMLLVALACIVHWLSPVSARLYANAGLGATAVAGGFCLMLAGWWLFRQGQTAIRPTDTPSTLITQGVYRLTRNPMYLGIFMMLLGIAVYFGGVAFYVAAISWLAVIDRSFCPYEEEKLERIFGADYRAYRNHVRRWL